MPKRFHILRSEREDGWYVGTTGRGGKELRAMARADDLEEFCVVHTDPETDELFAKLERAGHPYVITVDALAQSVFRPYSCGWNGCVDALIERRVIEKRRHTSMAVEMRRWQATGQRSDSMYTDYARRLLWLYNQGGTTEICPTLCALGMHLSLLEGFVRCYGRKGQPG